MHQPLTRSAYPLVVSLLIAGPNLGIYANPEQNQPEPTESITETIIEGSTAEKNDVQVTYFKDKSADLLPGDAAMLFHIPGLTLTENGGPLSSAQIRYRGLANQRLPVYLEGLSLNNPLT